MRPVVSDKGKDRDTAPERRVKPRWKVVVAAETPWRGTVYETRVGQRREEFDGPEEGVPSRDHAADGLAPVR